ncbi:fatty acid desaturase family protein [Enemella sp. A6]|uniref:fatty acid desaturase family protein n=1 Tax=Enemella sp. A6 TaxID=3440152 RepID=UPI003EBE96E7
MAIPNTLKNSLAKLRSGRGGHRLSSTRPKTPTATYASGKANPMAQLSAEDIEQIGTELDAIRQEVLDSRGEKDAGYIRRLIRMQRSLELLSRVVLLFSKFWPAWIVGTAGLSVSKILENMEIGHNVLHGQWDWMRDPKIHSTSWQWDMASPSSQWQQAHNVRHHTYTNVLGKDDDLGFNILRVDPDQKWQPGHLLQPMTNLLNAVFFQYGVAIHDLGTPAMKRGERDRTTYLADLRAMLKKVAKHGFRDYVLHPALSGPSAVPTLLANATANLVRNLWAHTVIFCGHLPSGVSTFETEAIEDETRGEWYVRQMLGSANISGGPLMHLMTGNLSYQIEHHVFPDLPSNRYAEVAPKVQELMERHGLHYVSGPLHKQAASAWRQVFRYALPNRGERRATLHRLARRMLNRTPVTVPRMLPA